MVLLNTKCDSNAIQIVSKCEICIIFMPIFHCRAKPLALGPCVGLDPQRDDFVFRYTNILVFKNPCRPNTNPGGPNASKWNILRVRYARLVFALFVSFFCVGYANSTQCKRGFQWNMDFTELNLNSMVIT